MEKFVSVIMPVYNGEKFISQSIESVISQTFSNWELIIIDDCSIDNTPSLLENLSRRENKIRVISLKERVGPSKARNIGIKEARGKYIAFLDSDDLWLPEKLQKQIDFMEKNDLAFTYSSYYLIDEDGNSLGEFIVKEIITYKDLLKTNSIGCLTAIYDTEKLGKMYMPDIKHEDYALWLSILRKIGFTKGIQEPLAIYRIRSNSVSSNKLKSVSYQWKIYRKVEKLSFFVSLYYFVHYIYFGLKKYNRFMYMLGGKK